MNNNTYIHTYIKPLISNDSICVDMTMGNGNDTYLLCRYAKKVYAFDISPEAVENTRKRIEEFNNYQLILDSHANVDLYIKERCDLFIFNLGYLPKAKEYTVTEVGQSLAAVKKAYSLLKENGYLIISFYLGQNGGHDEYYQITDYIKQEHMDVLETYRQERIESPITYIIKKSPR